MADTMVGNTAGGNYSWLCQICGQVVYGGLSHYCLPRDQAAPGWWPVYPSYPTYQPPAFTLEDVRRIVSEELDKRIPPIPPAPSSDH